MESEFNRIVSILIGSRILLNSIIHFATLLGASVSEQTKLERAIDNSTVNYRNAIQHLLEGWMASQGQTTVDDLVKILKGMEIYDVAEKLKEIFPSCTTLSTSSAVAIHRGRKLLKVWNVAEPVPSFVGREEEMLQLDNFLQNDKSRVLVISGMGGQGKTQLCRKWIQLLGKKTVCTRVIWLSGESSQVFTSSILSFLNDEVTHFDESVLKNFKDILDKIPTALKEEKEVVWIIDNVDTQYEEIKTFSCYILVKMGNSNIIVTSRLRTILPKSAIYLTLETLSPEAAKQLIRQSFDGDLQEKDVAEFCEDTGFHALALQLSIGFIKSKQISSAHGKRFGIKEFLSTFRCNKKPILEDTEELSGYDKNVLHHVQIAMHYLDEKGMQLPQEIMKILSLFRFDGVDLLFLLYIISKTIQGYGELEKDEKGKSKVVEALDALQSLSLIQAELPIILIHPLIQETTRILCSDWKIFASSILEHVAIKDLSKSNMQHILRLWDIVGREDSLLREHSPSVEGIYKGLLRTSQIQLLLPFTDSHRKSVLRLFGTSKEREVIRAEHCYGQALLDTGKFNEAFTHIEYIRTNANKHLELTDRITFGIEESMALALYYSGRYTEAENVYNSLLPRYITVYGEDHDESMKIKNNFALTLSKCNKEKEALQLHETVLQWRIRNIGKLHSNTLSTRHNIACCYAELGDFHKANSEFADILKLRREVLGEKHFETLKTSEWVADILRRKGDYDKAKIKYEELIEDSKEILGPTHPDTLVHRHNYASCLIELGELDKAITELENVIELKSRTLGLNQPDVEKSKILLQKAAER